MCASHDVLEEHHELQLEKHDGVNGGTTTTCIGFLHELTHKREVEGAFQVTVEMILRDSFFQRNMDEWSKASWFGSHHGDHLSSSPRRGSTRVVCFSCHCCGRSHSETCIGCIVSCTTVSSRSLNWLKSTSLCRVAAKVSRVFAASYLRR